MKAIIDRLAEPSTYAGLAAVAVAVGVSTEQFQIYAAAAAGLFGFIAMFVKEKGGQ